jgi:hypothetical protein
MTREDLLAAYGRNRDASTRTWRQLFDKERAGSYYRPYRASMGFSLNDYPAPFDFTIVEFSSQPTLEITNGEIFIADGADK